MASATYILRQVLNLGVTLYTPSVALNTVIGVPYWVSIGGLTGISIFFTVLVRIEIYGIIIVRAFSKLNSTFHLLGRIKGRNHS